MEVLNSTGSIRQEVIFSGRVPFKAPFLFFLKPVNELVKADEDFHDPAIN